MSSRQASCSICRISFFLKAESYFMVWMYHILLVHSSIDGHLGCSHFLAMVNLPISLNSSFPLAPSLQSLLVHVPAILSNESQPSLPLSFLPCPSKQHLMPSFVTYHWLSTELRPASLSLLRKLLVAKSRIIFSGAFVPAGLGAVDHFLSSLRPLWLCFCLAVLSLSCLSSLLLWVHPLNIGDFLHSVLISYSVLQFFLCSDTTPD